MTGSVAVMIIIGIILMIISVVSAIVIGLGLRNGKDNIEKLLDSVNKQKFH